MASLSPLLCSLLLLTVSAQEDPCYRQNINCHRSVLMSIVSWNYVCSKYVSTLCWSLCSLSCQMFNWITEVSAMWMMICREGENAIGTIPYFPDIWACELACRDTPACSWFTWWQPPTFNLRPHQLIWGMRTPASSTATFSPPATIR